MLYQATILKVTDDGKTAASETITLSANSMKEAANTLLEQDCWPADICSLPELDEFDEPLPGTADKILRLIAGTILLAVITGAAAFFVTSLLLTVFG